MQPSRVSLMERQALETGDASMLATLRVRRLRLPIDPRRMLY